MKESREKNISKDKIEKLIFLFNQGNLLKLIEEAKQLILKYPNSIFLWNIVGVSNARLKKLDESEKCFNESIKIDPNFIEGYYNLGKTQKELGKPAEAISNYKRAIELKPDYAEAYNNYTDSVKIKINDPILIKLDELINKKNQSEKNNIHLFFAMGKAQLDIEKPEKGMKLIIAGNSLRKKKIKYTTNKSKIIFNIIKNNFRNLNLKESKFKSSLFSNPIFIIGMPRSGTTLVEQILSSHSKIYGAGELDFLDNAIKLIDWQNNKLEKQDIKKIRENYIYELNKISKSPYTTDKMPLNFRWIGFIIHAFPSAKILHIKRDAMATCWSNYKTNFSRSGMAFTFDQIDIAEYYKLYEDLMKFWKKKFPEKIYEVNYEKLTENQETESRKIFNYLELKWESSVLEFYNNSRAVQTASNIQVRKKMYKGSSQQWKKYKPWLLPMFNNLKKN